jgi:hypothetical protein
VEQDSRGKHVFSVKEDEGFIDRMDTVLSGTDNKEFTNLAKEAYFICFC